MAKPSKAILKDFLKSWITLDGRMTVPRAIAKEANFPDGTFKLKDTLNRMMKPEEKETVKNFMLDNFYTNAIIPSAIKLRDTYPKYQYLNDELDLMLDSPACVLTFTLQEELVGAVINTVWLTNPDYETFPVNPTEWLNISGEIAVETTKDPLYRTVIWRNYQFLLIYHLIQNMAQNRKCSFFLYGGMGYQKPDYRDRGGTPIFLANCYQWAAQEEAFFSFMGTFPGFSDMIDRKLPGMFTKLAYVPYSDLTVNLFNDKPNFSDIKDGMILLASNPETD